MTMKFNLKGIAMAANALVRARIEASVKDEAAAVLAAMGLTISDAVRLLLTRVARDAPCLLTLGYPMQKPFKR